MKAVMDDITELLQQIRPGGDQEDAEKLYHAIRVQIWEELCYEDLPIVRVLMLLADIYAHDRALFETALTVLADPFQSMTKAGEKLGISHMTVSRHLRKLACTHQEIAILLQLRKKDQEQAKLWRSRSAGRRRDTT